MVTLAMAIAVEGEAGLYKCDGVSCPRALLLCNRVGLLPDGRTHCQLVCCRFVVRALRQAIGHIQLSSCPPNRNAP